MSAVHNDFIDSLGALVLDHRFKRLSLRLLGEAEALYAAAGLEFRPRWVSTYRLLDAEPWLAVGEIADRLRMSHPAVIQIAAGMRGAGLLRSRRDPKDGRRRLLALSDRASAMREELEALWAALAREQAALFEAAGVNVLEMLDLVSRGLDADPLTERVLTEVG